MITAGQDSYEEVELVSLTFFAALFTLLPHEIFVLAAFSKLRPSSTLDMVVPASFK